MKVPAYEIFATNSIRRIIRMSYKRNLSGNQFMDGKGQNEGGLTNVMGDENSTI